MPSRLFRFRCCLPALALFVAFCLCLPAVAPAATITYPDNGTLDGNRDLYPAGSSSGNTVIVNGNRPGETLRNMYGGYAPVTGNASANNVAVSGGRFAAVYGGYTDGGSAYGNMVTVTGSARITQIYGGRSTGDAYGNTVIVSGGVVGPSAEGTIRGGYSVTGSAYNNTVIITGTADVSNADIYGGSVGVGDSSYGNSLNLIGWSGSARNTTAFQAYNFVLPNTVGHGDTILTLTKTIPAVIDGATVSVNVMGGGTPLREGDSVSLMRRSSNILQGSFANDSATGMAGISKIYSFGLAKTNEELKATVTGIRDNPQLKSLSESRIAGLGMLNQGADMLHTHGIRQLRSAAMNISGPAVFAVMGGSSLRYDSGSHVDVDGFNLATGLGWNFALDEGRNGNVLLGAFFEAGWGSYDSHNSFGNAASVTGDGDTNYYGGGILGRYDTAPLGPGNVYLEASFRAGQVDTDYNSDDFYSATGEDVDFDSSSTYYGAHLGAGYIWNITDAASLDLYTKYLWTHQDSDTVTIQGDRIRFKGMDSHRWRTGARFAYALDTESGLRFAPYLGAAYEHEFDSEAKASSNGDSIDSPDVEGGTGIGELGFSFKASATSGLSFDLGMQGYTGKREGVGGSFQLKWEF